MTALAFTAFVLALAIGTLVGLHMQRTSVSARRAALLRQLEAAQRRHGATREIRRKLVQATTDQLRSEV